MIILENHLLTVKILEQGAELCSIVAKATNTEYLWQGDPDVWGKHSPILFPIVGSLKNNNYIYNQRQYNLPRHGFARDMDFELEYKDQQSACFVLRADTESLKVYPFLFELKVIYTLADDQLEVEYIVLNQDKKSMLFSIGGHPAFRMPIAEGLAIMDYDLNIDFEPLKKDSPVTFLELNRDGLIKKEATTVHANQYSIVLDEYMFLNDAWIYGNIAAAVIEISTPCDSRFIKMKYIGFPYLGIWGKYGAAFICIEPWQGIADEENTSGHLKDKKGIIDLGPAQQWRNSWTVQVG